jgi:hypothetical protein
MHIRFINTRRHFELIPHLIVHMHYFFIFKLVKAGVMHITPLAQCLVRSLKATHKAWLSSALSC